MLTAIYMIIPAMFFVLWLFSRGLELPEGINETGISREFLKVALFIYWKMQKSRRFLFFTPESVRSNLKALNNPKDFDRVQTEYFIRKISLAILLVTVGSFLALLMHVSVIKGANIDEEGRLVRNSYGEGAYEAKLIAENSEGERIGEIDYSVEERKYTEDETKELFEKASSEIEGAILGNNASLDNVTEKLDLVESLPGYPFEISWSISDYEIMHYDGSLVEEEIPAQGQVIMLTATYRYGDMSFSRDIYVNVRQKILMPYEQVMKNLNSKLESADKESAYSDRITLPDTLGEQQIIWRENTDDDSLILLVIMLVIGAASYILKDRELQKTVQDRSKALLMEYPQFTSKLVLYLGAGMTMRGIIEKLSALYLAKRRRGGAVNCLYEEIVKAARELKGGMPEGRVYERLGQRCGTQQYTRLCSLLSQNLKKGNSELLNLLQQEAEKAFADRLDLVRKEGEEAGTKLLLPMILMLVIVMIIIMIPAYMAF